MWFVKRQRRHYPPSRLRYEKEHPVVAVRLTREVKEVLDRVRESKSYAEVLKEVITKTLDAYKRGYDEGYREGHKKGFRETYFEVPCSICGRPMVFTARDPNWEEEKRVLYSAFKNWYHVNCLKKKREEESQLR